MNLNDDEDMLEVGADGLWSEGLSARFLEHDGHDVITNVPFSQQLMKETEKKNKQARVIIIN